MTDSLDRKWWDEDGRAQDWPESLKDHMHAETLAGYNFGMIQAGHPELCR